jgi:2-oxoglutarate dehydrogenase E2 component (dihydrolipoamide succinyltransferase)
MAVEVRIPSLGESVNQGVITRWLKENGAAVAADEPLFELETDKATMEIPAETGGRLEILKPAGETVEVGTIVGRITDGAGAGSAKAKPAAVKAAAPEPPKPAAAAAKRPAEPAKPSAAETAKSSGEQPAVGPAVRKLLEENHLAPDDVPGSGKGGRVTKEDVLRVIEGGKQAPAQASQEARAPAPAAPPRPAAAPSAPADDVERAPMTRLRRRIAERLVEAQRTAAILTTFNEIDMSAVIALRKRYKERFEKTHGVGLGFMSLFARACVIALRDLPIVNASIDGEDVVYHRRVHLGIAVSTPRGLVVPVVRNADSMSIAALEKAIGELAALARDAKLLPDHLARGTFTISNGGVYGSLMSTPILTPPQSAILGMHKIEERPVAVDGQVVIRPMMYVALSYDHRLVDGEQAVTFLVRVKERLEDPSRMVLEV